MPNNDYRLQLIADLSKMEQGLAKITNQLSGVVGGLKETDAALKTNATTSASAAASQTKFTTSLNSTRYALYDVSRTLLIAGAALLAFGLAPTKVAIDFQREFANVQRTVTGAGQGIKDQLKDLSTQIPATFKDLTEIATLGGQLGIAKDSIVAFTSTVAKLTATTNLTAEVAGTALGRFQSFGLVTSNQFDRLASAILKVGVNSVATESQIVTIATRIAGVGKSAGLSAQTLVGYAGALASVGVQTFAASGSTIRLVQKMQAAVNSGGTSLATFAKVAGVSTEEFRKAFGTEKFNPIFQSFIENLGNVQRTGKDVNLILQDLGLSGAIDSRTFTQLAAAGKTVSQAFSDANTGFKDASTLNEQYGRIAATTASKITELGNSILNLLDTIGSQTSGPVGDFVGFLIDLTKQLSAFLSTPIGQNLALLATGFSVLAGIVLLVGSAAARATASFIGLTTAIIGMDTEAAKGVGIFAALNAELAASNPLGAKAAAGMNLFTAAIKTASAAFVVGALSLGLGQLVDSVRVWTGQREQANTMTKTLEKAGNAYKKLIDGVVGAKGAFNLGSGILGLGNAAAASRQLSGVYDILQKINSFSGPQNLASSFDTTGILKFRDEIKQLDQAIAGETSKNPQKAAQAYAYLSQKLKDAGYSAKEIATTLPKSTAAIAKHKDEVEKAAQATQDFADKVGTSTTFLSDLQNAAGLDQKGLQTYIQAYQKSVQPLTDFNSIVKTVQDSLNTAAEAQAAAAGGNAKAKDYYDGTSVSLAQFTAQLQANNQAQSTWAANLVTLSTEAGPQAAQAFIDAGYSAVNASILQQLVDATPAQRDAYIAAQEEAARLASDATATALLASGFLVTDTGEKIGIDTAKKLAQGIQLGLPIEQLMASLNVRLVSNPLTPQTNTGPAQGAIDQLVRLNDGRTITIRVNASIPGGGVAGAPGVGNRVFASGGPVRGPGTGTSDSIPARLSNGEYVIKASRVRALGVPYLDALNGGRSRIPGHFADGGPVAGSNITSGIVELGPNTMNVMRGMIQREITVAIGSESIARSANNGNKRINRRGGA